MFIYLTLWGKNSPNGAFGCIKMNSVYWKAYNLHENEEDVLIYTFVSFYMPSQHIGSQQLVDSWAVQLEQDNWYHAKQSKK